MTPRIQSYSEFWPYYLGEHRLPSCRVLHYCGTMASWGMLLLGIFVSPWWLLAIPLAGYAPAWIGHFVIEKNRPATFDYPLWSLRGDHHMFCLWITGRLGPELARAAEHATQSDQMTQTEPEDS